LECYDSARGLVIQRVERSIAEGGVSQTARMTGLVITTLMLVFSGWMFLQTGDWVALVFAAVSLGYGIFFLSVTPRRGD
jgi:hypothetical protein